MNPKVTKMTPFIVMDVLERANALQAEGIDVIHLEVGEPDFNIPACVADAAIKAYQDGKTHYTHSLGSPLLRQKIADFYVQEYGVTVNPDCIVVTSGSSPAILMVLMLLCEAGSEVILSNPGYACYSNFALAVNANPVQVLLKPENKFQYKLEDIRAALSDQTRAIFVNSPMNPTGGLVDDAVFEGLATLNVPIISDEIYHATCNRIALFSGQDFLNPATVNREHHGKNTVLAFGRIGLPIAQPDRNGAILIAIQKKQQQTSLMV